MIKTSKQAEYVKELWRRWSDARKEWEDHAREDIDFYLGNHFQKMKLMNLNQEINQVSLWIDFILL